MDNETDNEAGTRKPRRARRRVVAVVIGTAGALAATAAFAAWTVGGGGTGTATATSALPLTTSVATTTAALYPGITGSDAVPQGEQPEPVPGRDHLGERERCRGAGRRSPDVLDDGRDLHDDRGHPDGGGERHGDLHGAGRRDVERFGHRLPGCDVHHPGDVHGRQRLIVRRTGVGLRLHSRPPTNLEDLACAASCS